ncbi:FtsB family cell division protein [Streptomyces xiamenensis]|uniref:S-adenosyl-L-methionine-dependent methyltransferase MraW n=1 Tax=Streptomyces xiamenensis TaxID=408015 RepID=A0A0F7FS81_9ACTN|nr:hypothetical protein [Streptomyces xiamenensis]AKG42415.1 S-adenosyl-L-methionine-dependent methyltransferase MraW [Streptomyces xiamenensis]
MSPKRREPGPQTRIARLTGLVPAGRGSAARTPFVLLIVLLLGAGMLALLLLNASLNQGSFELSELRRHTQELTDEQQALQAEVDAFSAPGALSERARELGLVPAGPPAFLDRDGTVTGEPSPAPEPPPDPEESDTTDGTNGTDGTDPADTPETPETPQDPDTPDGTDPTDESGPADAGPDGSEDGAAAGTPDTDPVDPADPVAPEEETDQ